MHTLLCQTGAIVRSRGGTITIPEVGIRCYWKILEWFFREPQFLIVTSVIKQPFEKDKSSKKQKGPKAPFFIACPLTTMVGCPKPTGALTKLFD
jgi:hypothetical protein